MLKPKLFGWFLNFELRFDAILNFKFFVNSKLINLKCQNLKFSNFELNSKIIKLLVFDIN